MCKKDVFELSKIYEVSKSEMKHRERLAKLDCLEKENKELEEYFGFLAYYEIEKYPNIRNLFLRKDF